MQSPKGTINLSDWKSIVITLLMVGASAIISQAIVLVPMLNLGHDTTLYTGLILTVLKVIQKTLDGPTTSSTQQSSALP